MRTNQLVGAIARTELDAAGFDDETVVHVDKPNQYGDRVEEIQYIEVGDAVLSWCERTGKVGYKRVLSKLSYGWAQQYMLECHEKIQQQPELRYVGPLFASAKHHFRVEGKGWVAVADLKAGDALVTHDGVYMELRHISKGGVHEVLSLEVEDFHTFFVTHSGILVRDALGALSDTASTFHPAARD